ncbi:MAG: glutathione S-transferase family protein [Caulobacteraceae bacterium]
MALCLFTHPFSSYSQKALIALYENDTPFTPRVLGPDDPSASGDLERLWPLKKFPVLTDGERTVIEATSIIEYLDRTYPGPTRLIPEEFDAALDARTMDRVFDNYVMTPMQTFVVDAIRPAETRDPHGVVAARGLLDAAYGWLDGVMAAREWAAGGAFTLADCAAAPSLFYADWVHPIDPGHGHLRAYRARLLARPSVARCVEEARPYRHLFPPGAPDRD